MEYLKITIEQDNKKVSSSKNDYYGYRFKNKDKISSKDLEIYYKTERVKQKQRNNSKIKKKRKQRTYKNRTPRKYSVYIKSVHWERRKNNYWKKYQKKCCVCGSCKHVQLHHGKYDWNKFGIEPDSWMFPMCQYHHNDFHEAQKNKADMIAETLNYINDNYVPHDSTNI